jgi:hypothetical protein
MPSFETQAPLAVAAAGVLAAALALLWAAAAWRRAGRLERHYRALMTGVDGTDLASVMEALGRRLGAAEGGLEGLLGTSSAMEARLDGALQRFGVVRFDAFGDARGGQSFAIALLDAAGNGVVLSSLHGRDGVRVYAKPLRQGVSEFALSDEEQGAVDAARSGGAAGN